MSLPDTDGLEGLLHRFFCEELKLLKDETRMTVLLAVGIGGAFLIAIRYGIHAGYLTP